MFLVWTQVGDSDMKLLHLIKVKLAALRFHVLAHTVQDAQFVLLLCCLSWKMCSLFDGFLS